MFPATDDHLAWRFHVELTVDYKMSHHYKMSLNWTEATENLAQDRGAMVEFCV